MIKLCQIEERLASAIREYVRACGNVRRAELARSVYAEADHGFEAQAADARVRSARHIAATAKKILRGTESTFDKVGGDFDSMSRRLRLVPTDRRPPACGDTPIGFVPAVAFADDPGLAEDMTADAGCGRVAE